MSAPRESSISCTRWPRQPQPCHKLMPSEPHAWCQPCTDWVEMDDEIRQAFATKNGRSD